MSIASQDVLMFRAADCVLGPLHACPAGTVEMASPQRLTVDVRANLRLAHGSHALAHCCDSCVGMRLSTHSVVRTVCWCTRDVEQAGKNETVQVVPLAPLPALTGVMATVSPLGATRLDSVDAVGLTELLHEKFDKQHFALNHQVRPTCDRVRL